MESLKFDRLTVFTTIFHTGKCAFFRFIREFTPPLSPDPLQSWGLKVGTEGLREGGERRFCVLRTKFLYLKPLECKENIFFRGKIVI